MPQKILFQPTDLQRQALANVSQQTGLTMSDLLRRMLDHCLNRPVMNELIPAMSGCIRCR